MKDCVRRVLDSMYQRALLSATCHDCRILDNKYAGRHGLYEGAQVCCRRRQIQGRPSTLNEWVTVTALIPPPDS